MVFLGLLLFIIGLKLRIKVGVSQKGGWSQRGVGVGDWVEHWRDQGSERNRAQYVFWLLWPSRRKSTTRILVVPVWFHENSFGARLVPREFSWN